MKEKCHGQHKDGNWWWTPECEHMKFLSDYSKQIGKQGGNSTKEKHPDHFKEIGKKGAAKRWKK